MKTQKLFLATAMLFVLLTSLQCKKEKTGIDALPPITQEGKNTFGCLVNGEVLIPKGSGFNIVLKVEKSETDYFIRVIHNEKGSIILRLIANNANDASINCIDYTNYKTLCSYSKCAPSGFTLKLSKLDEDKKIISGEFSGTLPAMDNCEEIKITKGRFDLKFD